MKTIVLVDNGSLRPNPSLQLREIGHELEKQVMNSYEDNVEVIACSARHSNKISSDKLDGHPAKLLDSVLKHWVGRITSEKHEHLKNHMIIIPFFLGPSRTVSSFIKKQVEEARNLLSQLQDHQNEITFLPHLVEISSGIISKEDINDPSTIHGILAGMITEQQQKLKAKDNLLSVILVDHGSGDRIVNATRRSVAAMLRMHSQLNIPIVDCSMENPLNKKFSQEDLENKAVNFNFPLLSDVLSERFGFDSEKTQTVIISYLFLAEGRHAGKDGDIDEILESAKKAFPKLNILKTNVIGHQQNHQQLIKLLMKKINSVI